jgi:hypothetical protein
MAAGIIWFLVNFMILAVACLAGAVLYMKGYKAGMQSEAKDWINAINKVTPPNWQSLPTPEGADPEKSKEFRKLYVDTFKIALDVIKEEIAANRLETLMKNIADFAAGKEPNRDPGGIR